MLLIMKRALNLSILFRCQRSLAMTMEMLCVLQDASTQSIFFNHRDFLCHNGDSSDPKSIFMVSYDY